MCYQYIFTGHDGGLEDRYAFVTKTVLSIPMQGMKVLHIPFWSGFVWCSRRTMKETSLAIERHLAFQLQILGSAIALELTENHLALAISCPAEVSSISGKRRGRKL
jgi:hypothetical protein